MDELRVKLGSKLMRGIISKLITKTVKKKLGYDIDIQFDDLVITTVDNGFCLHADVSAEISKDEFMKAIKSIGLD